MDVRLECKPVPSKSLVFWRRPVRPDDRSRADDGTVRRRPPARLAATSASRPRTTRTTTPPGPPSTRRSSGVPPPSSGSATTTTWSRRSSRPTTSASRSRSAAAGTASPATRWPTARWSSTSAIDASVTVDPTTRIVRSPAGRCGRTSMLAAWRHHLAVVGGTVIDTGVGRADARRRDRLAVGHRRLHLRQPRPRRARDRRRRTGRGRSGRRSGPALGPARRRRQLRRGHELRVPGDRSRARSSPATSTTRSVPSSRSSGSSRRWPRRRPTRSS